MKKTIIFIYLILLVTLLSACGLRERLLAPPDEVEIPSGSMIALCSKDEVTYSFIYQNDGVYEYIIDDVVQNDEILTSIIEEAYNNHGSSIQSYLDQEFSGTCLIEEYN